MSGIQPLYLLPGFQFIKFPECSLSHIKCELFLFPLKLSDCYPFHKFPCDLLNCFPGPVFFYLKKKKRFTACIFTSFGVQH